MRGVRRCCLRLWLWAVRCGTWSKEGRQDRIDGLPIAGYMTGARLMGAYLQKEVLLRDFILGGVRCNDTSAIVSEARNQPTDGLLSVVQLGAKIIHFDFDRNLMTWKK